MSGAYVNCEYCQMLVRPGVNYREHVQRCSRRPLSDELPAEIRSLIAQCEVNVSSFDNDQMSAALHFGEMLWRRLSRLSDHYERQSNNFMPGDVRSPMMAQAAADMRQVMQAVREATEERT